MPEEIISIKPNRDEIDCNIEPSPPPLADPGLENDSNNDVGINCPTTTTTSSSTNKENRDKKILDGSTSRMDQKLKQEDESMTASSSDNLESSTRQESNMSSTEDCNESDDWLLKVIENRIQDYASNSEPPASTSATNTAAPPSMSSREGNESDDDWLLKVIEDRIQDYASNSEPPASASETNTAATPLQPLQIKDHGSEPSDSTSEIDTAAAAPALQSLQRQQRLQQRPGAYSGVPGVELQRMQSLRLSLVGGTNQGSVHEENATIQDVEDEEMANTTTSSSTVEPQESPTTTYEMPNYQTLLEAVLVEEEEEKDKAMVLPLAEAKQAGLRDMLSHRKMQGLIGFLVVLLVVAVVVVVVVLVTRNNQDNDIEVGPYPLLPNLPNFTLGALQVSDSTQSQAYRWLEKVAQVDQLDDWRRYQLYSLATIYYTLWDQNTGIQYREMIDPWLNSTAADVKECHSEDMMTIVNITCNRMNRVTGLAFDGNQGTQNTSGILQALTREGIPPEISLLSSLETLTIQNIDTWNVQMQALLPARLDENENFTSLTIKNNSQVKGDLPSYIGQFQRLQSLYISENALSSNQLPTELGLITTLERFHYQQDITELLDDTVPSEFGKLVQLQELSLPGNRYVDVPTEIGNLAELQTLDLGRNRLTFIPSELGRLAKLQVFSMPQNEIEDLPTEIGNLEQLQTIDLSWNSLLLIPSELGRLEETQSLSLPGNQFSGTIPTEIGNLRNLRTIDLKHNSGLKGEIPRGFSQMSHLKVLKLSRANGLNLTNFLAYGFESLEHLDMSFAAISSFPAGIFSLSNLKYLNLEGNSLRAPIPTEVGLLNKLEHLLLRDTALHNATIVSELGLLSKLLSLDISGTFMVGSLPTELGVLTKLSDLRLEQISYLTGPIPSQLGELTDLEFLHLSETDITGTIPTELALLTHLKSLALYNTDLTGAVPEQICKEDVVEDFVVGVSCSNVECPHSCNTTCTCVECLQWCTARQTTSCGYECVYPYYEFIVFPSDLLPFPESLP